MGAFLDARNLHMKTAKRKPVKIETDKGTMRDRIGRPSLRRLMIGGKYSLSLVIVASLVLLYAVAVNYRRNNDPAQLKFVESSIQPGGNPTTDADRNIKPVFAGEAHDTVQRLRECSALVMAVSLAAFEEFRINGEFPSSLGPVLNAIQNRSLLPPGMEIRNGAARSSWSELKISYRSDPFSFEIFSLPSNEVEGPAMLFRFPLPPSGANSVMYFESSKRQVLPAPFSTTEELAAAGWTIRNWSADALPLDEASVRELQEHDAWLRSQIEK